MMSKTKDNLKNAFAGESQANRRYIAFAKKADEEDHSQIAKLFRAAAEAETVHALNHLKIMGEPKSTMANLETAISGETFEYKSMYPEYLKAAKEENDKEAIWSFDVANKVEQIHANLYGKALEALKSGKEVARTDYYICSVCGNTVENAASERCPICGATRDKFFKAT
jgi:rubrerythrin